MSKIAVLINVRDRPTELTMLLQSLKTQTHKDFDIFILDDQSGTPLGTYHFFNCMITRLKLEGHKVFLQTTEFPHGVSKARQRIVDWAKDDYEYLMRVDDDVILESDFIERLLNVIKEGYDLASGVTPPMGGPTFVRNSDCVGPIINRVIIKDGKFILNGDDCGMQYTDSVILPTHHFRSSALYKTKIHDKVNYTPTKLSNHGFREEQIFSFKCLLNGFKLGVDTGAIAWHQQTPSGGERFPDQAEKVKFNQDILLNYIKDNPELEKLFPNEPQLTDLQLKKENNLLM